MEPDNEIQRVSHQYIPLPNQKEKNSLIDQKKGLYKKTRSDPPDRDDPYRQDLLYEKHLTKYQKMLQNHQQQQEPEVEQKTLKKKAEEQEVSPINQNLTNLLKSLDPNMEQSLLNQIIKESKTISKDI